MLMRAASILCSRLNMVIPLNPNRGWRQQLRARVRQFLVVVGALALISAVGISNAAQAQTVEEHDAKAIFLFKLVNFVQWPSEGSGDLVVGFIGADSTADSLQRLAYGKPVNGKKIVVRHLNHDSDLKGYNVIFLGSLERKNAPSVLERLRGASVLTVGESDGFGQHGGVVNLLLNEGRIRFEVNPHAAERAHLLISSKLLALATVVADAN